MVQKHYHGNQKSCHCTIVTPVMGYYCKNESFHHPQTMLKVVLLFLFIYSYAFGTFIQSTHSVLQAIGHTLLRGSRTHNLCTANANLFEICQMHKCI